MFIGVIARIYREMLSNYVKTSFRFDGGIWDLIVLVPGNSLIIYCRILNSLTTKKQKTKFWSANFQKMLSSSYDTLRIQRLEGKQCRSKIGG